MRRVWLQSNVVFPVPTPSSGKVRAIDVVCLVEGDESSVNIVSSDKEEKSFRLSQYSTEHDVLMKSIVE